MEGVDDEKREAAIAATPLLRSNFKPNTKLSEAQLAKFQELHRRRLKLKAKSNTKKKSKGIINGPGGCQGEDLIVKESTNEDLSTEFEDSSLSFSIGSKMGDNSLQEKSAPKEMASKKRQKLHWGLDTKERWERKSNM